MSKGNGKSKTSMGKGKSPMVKTFEDLRFKERPETESAVREYAQIFFPNKYGISVIRGPETYGGPLGLYEAAVIKRKGKGVKVVTSTPVTGSVIGWLKPTEVTIIMAEIQSLPKGEDKGKGKGNEKHG